MGEVYWGRYLLDGQGLMRPDGPEVVITPEQVELPPDGGWEGVGSGWEAYGDRLGERLGDRLRAVDPAARCEAQDLIPLAVAGFAKGLAVSAEQALPVYLRDRVTHGG